MITPILAMLTASGLTPEDLVRAVGTTDEAHAETSTLCEYVAIVRRSLTEDTDKSYATHYNHLINGVARQCSCTCDDCIDEWAESGTCSCTTGLCAKGMDFPALGSRRVTPRAFTQTELEPLVKVVGFIAIKRAMYQNRARARRGLAAKPTHGQGAQEMCVTALRHLFSKMIKDHLIDSSPVSDVSKGHRSASKRRAISDGELEEVLTTVASGGDDPLLDLAISWAEFELGARRAGVLRMTISHIDRPGQYISLWEKGNKFRSQPCSLALIDFLLELAAKRGGAACVSTSPKYNPNAAVLYFKDSTTKKPHPLSGRRFDTLHRRIQLALPWANSITYTGHALRHTIGTTVERAFGFETAKAFLGHATQSSTDVYTKASVTDVAHAMSDITGCAHPLVSNDESCKDD
jgi:integrase